MIKFAIVFILLLFFLSGCGNEKVEINGAVLDYEQLLVEVDKGKTELSKIETNTKTAKGELDKVNLTMKENKEKHDGLEALAKNRDKVESDVKSAESTLKNLQSDIEIAKAELRKLQGDIVKTKKEPLKVGAGFFYFGEDIAPGRYKIMAQDGHRGNIFIRNDGRSYVADTFGNGSSDSVTDFVFESVVGDEIEATIPILLYPVE